MYAYALDKSDKFRVKNASIIIDHFPIYNMEMNLTIYAVQLCFCMIDNYKKTKWLIIKYK